MPKKRRTRKQKILVDQKKHMVHEPEPVDTSSQKVESQTAAQNTATPDITFSLPTTTSTKQPTPRAAKPAVQTVSVLTTEYGYLGKDLVKTALLTGAIIIAELLIRFLYLH